MRERSQTAPRRRGPVHPLPPRDFYENRRDIYEPPEPPYYTIDNTEEIYGTNLLPSQRCYVDPWDLENYDYVKKKLESTPSPSGYYENQSSSPSPTGETISSKYYYMPQPEREELSLAQHMSSTIPRHRRRNVAPHFQCDLDECWASRAPMESPRRFELESPNAGLYGRCRSGVGDKYGDYRTHMADQLQLEIEDLEQSNYTGYGGVSSSSSMDRNSSLCDGSISSALLHHTPGYGAANSRRHSVAVLKPPPQIEFPAPPPVSPTYESFSNPYATLPYCSVSDCYECLYAAASSIYGGASTSIYGGSYSTLGRRPSSSLYGGVYANKFGMSKKGLLQIDYSCSWNDLDRVIGRNF